MRNCQISQDPLSGNRIIMMAWAWAVRDRVCRWTRDGSLGWNAESCDDPINLIRLDKIHEMDSSRSQDARTENDEGEEETAL